MHAVILMAYEAYKAWHKHEDKMTAKAKVQHLLLGSPLSPPHVTLLSDRELDALALRQRHPRLRTLAQHKDVGDTDIASQSKVV